MNITMVRKIKLDGELCHKSAKVHTMLADLGLLSKIHRIVDSDERKINSEGLILAQAYQVCAAPFFIVVDKGSTRIYTAYSRFLKEVFGYEVSQTEVDSELIAQNEWIDLI